MRPLAIIKISTFKLKNSHLSVIGNTRCFDEPQGSFSMSEVLNKFISDPYMYIGST